jgi:glucose/arabinose dehydrogenase
MKKVVVLVAVLALFAVPGALASTPDWKEASPLTVVSDLGMPADVQVAPDGGIWFIEIAGNVSRYDPATKKVEVKHHVNDVITGGERGLVGFALAKDFEKTGTFFLYYTQRNNDPDGGDNRLVSVTGGKETVLLTVPGAKEHNGGRIVVDADGNLFVGTGENQKRDPAQDLDSVLGKILHLTPTGQPVEGNVRGLVYSSGHRNPFGLAIDPDTGELWETENSGWRRDEVNLIEAGGNYGYPECEGMGLNGVDTPCPTTKGYTFPVRTYYETDAVAPTGATFWRGELYWASLNEGSIHHTWQDLDSFEWMDAIVLADQMPILDLTVGPDDALYIATVDSILKVGLPDIDVGNVGGTPGGVNFGEAGGAADASHPGIVKPGSQDGSTVPKGIGAAPFVAVLAAVAVALLVRSKRLG